MIRPRIRLRYADVAATLALVVALSGTAYAATSLAKNSVGTPQLRAGAVTKPKLGKGSVTGGAIARDSVSLADLVGIDVSGKVSFTVAPHSCSSAKVIVKGAKSGQSVLVSFTSAPPSGLMMGTAQVASARLVRIPMCNVTDKIIDDKGQGIRVVTLG
jgi:hypothetical protein